MNDDQLDDLKQFIDGRVGHAETRLEGKIDDLREEMLDGFTSVGEAVEEINDRLDKFEISKRPA